MTSPVCIDYCKKEGCFHEFEVPGGRPKQPSEQGHNGVKGGQLIKEEWQYSWELAKKGKIEEISPRKRVRYLSSWLRVQSTFPPKLKSLSELKNLWIHGPSGSGKSRWVELTYPYCTLVQ